MIDCVLVKGQPHSFDEGTLLIGQYLLLDIESFAPAAVQSFADLKAALLGGEYRLGFNG